MRQIEKMMLEAISNGKRFRVGNTEVEVENNEICVKLHGNLIAVINNNTVKLFSRGWRTNTTKSRLNAILTGLCGGGIVQKKFDWYLFSGGNLFDFQEGMTISRM